MLARSHKPPRSPWPPIRQTERVTPLRETLAAIRAARPECEALADNSPETWLALADTGELDRVTPLLLGALLDGTLPDEASSGLLGRWHPDVAGRSAELVEFAERWWAEALWGPEDQPAHPVLAEIVHLGEPMARWLQPWLDDLDGEPAVHLATAVLADWEAPGFAGLPDLREQCRSWAATEPVVFGLTLVGGVHLDGGVLGDVLDRLVSLD